MTTPTVPDLATVEAYHAAVIAAIDAMGAYEQLDREAGTFCALADRALDGLRRHRQCGIARNGLWTSTCISEHPCPDALDRWADLTAIGTTYGVPMEAER